jgi:hypothetical protein
MKKFMFSAVALIAFSFAGMANTGGEEKIDQKELEQEVAIRTNCDALANAVMDLYESFGYSVEDAYQYGSDAYHACIAQ